MKTKLKHAAILLLSIAFITIESCKKESKSVSNPVDKTVTNELNAEKAFIKTDSNFVDINSAKNYAETIDYTAVRRASHTNLAVIPAALHKQARQIITVNDANQKSAFYIVKYTQGGFCIISADKRAPSILAYSDTNNFDETLIPAGLNLWLYQTKVQIENIRKDTSGTFVLKNANYSVRSTFNVPTKTNDAVIQTTVNNGLTTITTTAGPLLATLWDQGSGYNDDCPTLACSTAGNSKAWTGCVATAMAQVMAYYKYPSSYNFSIMNNYSGSPETARLMFDIGHNLGMDYTECDGSGVDGSKTNSGFANFGYTSSGTNNSFDASNINASFAPYDVIKNEINANRPVIISGGRQGTAVLIFHTYKDGHEWVCDGYQIISTSKVVCRPVPRGGCSNQTVSDEIDYYHMNWGWSGMDNGYYQLGSLGPTLTGSDQSSKTVAGSYNYDNVLYYNIHP